MAWKRGTNMRTITALAFVVIISLVLFSGCAQTNLESSKDHTARIKRNMQKDCRNIAEDWDRFWMADTPSRTTPNALD